MTYQVSPFSALNQFNRELTRLFDDHPSGQRQPSGTSWSPQVDVAETEDGFQVTADIPGVSPEDIEISLHNGQLTIRGERKSNNEPSSARFSRRERFLGTFSRQFNLPDSADQETVTAKTSNGVLEIFIPKAKKAKPISITVQGE
jgi:HSP20 family protein